MIRSGTAGFGAPCIVIPEKNKRAPHARRSYFKRSGQSRDEEEMPAYGLVLDVLLPVAPELELEPVLKLELPVAPALLLRPVSADEDESEFVALELFEVLLAPLVEALLVVSFALELARQLSLSVRPVGTIDCCSCCAWARCWRR